MYISNVITLKKYGELTNKLAWPEYPLTFPTPNPCPSLENKVHKSMSITHQTYYAKRTNCLQQPEKNYSEDITKGLYLQGFKQFLQIIRSMQTQKTVSPSEH